MSVRRPILPSMPALGALAALVAGILAGYFTGSATVWLTVGTVAATLIAYVADRRRIAALGLFAVLGMAAYTLARPPRVDIPETGITVAVTAHVAHARQNELNQRLVLEVEEGAWKGVRLLVYSHALTPVVGRGDRISAQLHLMPPDVGFKVPDEFSMVPYCRTHHIAAIAHCGEGAIRVVGYAPDWSDRLSAWREKIADFIFYRTGLRPDTAEMLCALLTGCDDFLDENIRAEFTTAGLAHVLALSGTHLAVIAMILGLLLIPMRMVEHRRAAGTVLLACLWGYVALTGASPSVVRACLMVSIVAFGRFVSMSGNSLNSLCVAGILILIFNPEALFMPGFQLSFAAVGAILMFGAKIRDLGGRSQWGRLLLGWGGVCVAAVAGTALISAWHFHEFPLLFLASNLPVGLLLPWFMGLGMLKMAFAVAGIHAVWLAGTLNAIYDVMTATAQWVGDLGFSSVKGLYFSAWWLVPYFLALILLWLAWEQRRLLPAIGAGFVAVVAVIVALLIPDGERDTESYAIYDYYATTLLLRDGREVWFVTDAPEKYHQSLIERTSFRLDKYYSRRGVDSVRVVSRLRHPYFRADGKRWTTSGSEVVLLNADWRQLSDNEIRAAVVPVSDRKLILLVTTGFRGDLPKICRMSGADRIAISRRLAEERREKLAEALASEGIPFAIGLEGEL